MNYGALSEKYFNEANILKKYIKNLKAEFKTKGVNEERCFKERISMLYKIYLELLHMGRYLKRKQELMERCKKRFCH